MNRKRWLLVALLVGCAAAVATMTVTIPERILHGPKGMGRVTVDNTEYSVEAERGDADPVTGLHPYTVAAIVLPDIPSGTYTGTVSVLLGSTTDGPSLSEVIGSCRVVVNAENQTHDVPVWFDADGTLPPGAP